MGAQHATPRGGRVQEELGELRRRRATFWESGGGLGLGMGPGGGGALAGAALVRATRTRYDQVLVLYDEAQYDDHEGLWRYLDDMALWDGRSHLLSSPHVGRTIAYLGLGGTWLQDRVSPPAGWPRGVGARTTQLGRVWTPPAWSGTQGGVLGRWDGVAGGGPPPTGGWVRPGSDGLDAHSPTTARSDASDYVESASDEVEDSWQDGTGAAEERALERCPEECWICEEHEDPAAPCCFPAEIPHREHICQGCRSLLLRANRGSPWVRVPPPSPNQSAARSIVRWYLLLALGQEAVALDPWLQETGRCLARLARAGAPSDGMVPLEHWQVHQMQEIFDRVRAQVDGLLNRRDVALEWLTLDDLSFAGTPSSAASSPRSWQAGPSGECEEWGLANSGGRCQACLLRLPEAERLTPPGPEYLSQGDDGRHGACERHDTSSRGFQLREAGS